MSAERIFTAAAMITFASVVAAQGQASDPREFVQRFYDWYTPMAVRMTYPPAWGEVLKSRREEFSGELLDLLAKDLAAKGKCEDSVGIDYDPFLNTLVSSGKYRAGAVRTKKGKLEVEVFAAGEFSDKSDPPEVGGA